MRILFIMDPAESMLPDKDTTFAFLRAAGARGHRCFHCAPGDLSARGPHVSAVARPLTVHEQAPHARLGAREHLDLTAMDAVMVRKDPPFDTEYLHLTRMLDLVKHETFVCNDPRGLRDANEKLFALRFSEWMPDTMVTRDPEVIHAFVREVGGQAVLKPLDGAGGSGVVALRTEDKNSRALVDLLTHEGRVQVMAQQFLPDIESGDKRVLMLDGEPVGAILRVPRPDDIRANIHVGGQVEATELTERELELVRALGPQLVSFGLFFVGLDLIGGHLIEVNVTSPTGIQELGRLTGTTPEVRVIEWLEGRVL
jgi:glutathione synthase